MFVYNYRPHWRDMICQQPVNGGSYHFEDFQVFRLDPETGRLCSSSVIGASNESRACSSMGAVPWVSKKIPTTD